MSKKILVVEDTEETRDMVFELLNMSDYDVYTAADGRDALDMVEQNAPDLIIMDIMMPKITGIETARELKKDERYKNIPIIFMSGYSNINVKELKALGGRQDFVSKPLDMELLLEKINKLIG